MSTIKKTEANVFHAAIYVHYTSIIRLIYLLVGEKKTLIYSKKKALVMLTQTYPPLRRLSTKRCSDIIKFPEGIRLDKKVNPKAEIKQTFNNVYVSFNVSFFLICIRNLKVMLIVRPKRRSLFRLNTFENPSNHTIRFAEKRPAD